MSQSHGHTHPPLGPTDERTGAAIRGIRRKLEEASSPLEVFRLAIATVSPILGADFASVFLRDHADPGFLRLACARNWPQSSARFLSEIRIREGQGPTGRAVKQARPVEVANVFEDPGMEEWRGPARELGFVSMTAHPLVNGGRVIGSLSFYFTVRQHFRDRERALLVTAARVVAEAAVRAQTER